jgi:hypothetical protein
MYELLKFWKEKKSILDKSLNFFTTANSIFLIYLSTPNFKTVQHWKKITNSQKIPSYLSSYQNVLLVFYFQFWELFITISDFNNLCFELTNVSDGPNEVATIP